GGGQGDQVAILLERARAADAATKGGLRRILAEACVAGGEGARDGGRTRSFLLGQAATSPGKSSTTTSRPSSGCRKPSWSMRTKTGSISSRRSPTRSELRSERSR